MPGLWERLLAAILSPSRLKAAPTGTKVLILNEYRNLLMRKRLEDYTTAVTDGIGSGDMF